MSAEPVPKLERTMTPAMRLYDLQERIVEKDHEGNVVGGGILHETFLDHETGKEKSFILIANPFIDRPEVYKIPTNATAEEVSEVHAEILPIPESYELLSIIAHAYSSNESLIVEGPTSIGKTFMVDQFAKLLSGTDARVVDIYCNEQTDATNFTGKFVPNREGAKEGEDTPPQFTIRYGALPRAMGTVVNTAGETEIIGDTEKGGILHVQELGLAVPAISLALLEMRGYKGKIAKDIVLWDADGDKVIANENFWMVMSTNPPEGYVDRNEIDPALIRGSIYVILGEISSESLEKAAKHYLRQEPVNGEELGEIDIAGNEQIVELIGTTLASFHETFRNMLKDGEVGRKQKTPSTLTDISRVADYMKTRQCYSPETSQVDFAETLRRGIDLYYLKKVSNPETKTKLKTALEKLLTGDLGKVPNTDGDDVTWAAAIDSLVAFESMTNADKLSSQEIRFNQVYALAKSTIESSEGIDSKREALMRRLGEYAARFESALEQQDLAGATFATSGIEGYVREIANGFIPEFIEITTSYSHGIERIESSGARIATYGNNPSEIFISPHGSQLMLIKPGEEPQVSPEDYEDVIMSIDRDEEDIVVADSRGAIYVIDPENWGSIPSAKLDTSLTGMFILDEHRVVIGGGNGMITVRNIMNDTDTVITRPNSDEEGFRILKPGRVSDGTILAGLGDGAKGPLRLIDSSTSQILFETISEDYADAVVSESRNVLASITRKGDKMRVYDLSGQSDGSEDQAGSTPKVEIEIEYNEDLRAQFPEFESILFTNKSMAIDPSGRYITIQGEIEFKDDEDSENVEPQYAIMFFDLESKKFSNKILSFEEKVHSTVFTPTGEFNVVTSDKVYSYS